MRPSTTTTVKLVERITGRVFCHGVGGGNPVTVFASATALSKSLQLRLAKECDWESVMVAKNENSNPMDRKKSLSEFTFYLPSGLQMNFCAHAAMGAAFAVANRTEWAFRTAALRMASSSSSSDEGGGGALASQQQQQQQNIYKVSLPSSYPASDDNKNAILYMQVPFTETKISHPPALQRMLREHLGLDSSHLVSKSQYAPTFLNASVARPKTMVYVNSIQALANVKAPKTSSIDDNVNHNNGHATKRSSHHHHHHSGGGTGPPPRTSFSMACEAMDDSTGIYLYTNRDEVGRTTAALTAESASWECRQFPKLSGYPEDPATGIAAAALAASLYQRGLLLKEYNFYQGTHMNRPSLIQVVDLLLQETYEEPSLPKPEVSDSAGTPPPAPILASFGLKGRVEIDGRDWLELEDEVKEEVLEH
jgi:predicted PhzF superfamily epimerase YddE/YHI9